MNQTDIFIGQLYRSAATVDLAHYRQWALSELNKLIPFDGAVWSSGHLSTRTFHTHTSIGLPDEFLDVLIQNLPQNPISRELYKRIGEPVDMSDVIDDDKFYQSDIYHNCFSKFQVQRILSSVHIDSRSGVYTLLSLYRFDRENRFTANEKTIQQRVLYHLLNAASHACIMQFSVLSDNDKHQVKSAICDHHGIYHEVENEFLDLMEATFPNNTAQQLPFALPDTGDNHLIADLKVEVTQLGDLFKVDIRPQNPLDKLTERETQVVQAVTQGLSFKAIAKKLDLSPSTVANHLYRVYNKLGINSRTALADLVNNL